MIIMTLEPWISLSVWQTDCTLVHPGNIAIAGSQAFAFKLSMQIDDSAYAFIGSLSAYVRIITDTFAIIEIIGG